MLIARTLQVAGCLGIAAGIALGVLTFTGREGPRDRAARQACEAMARLESVTVPRVPVRRCAEAPDGLAESHYLIALSGALGGLMMLGFAGLMLDVRRMRELAEREGKRPAGC